MSKTLRVLRPLLGAATVALCLLLCWQAVDIWRVGNLPENFTAAGVRIQQVYSREIVGERLASIAPALLAYAVLTAATLILQAASREKAPSPAPGKPGPGERNAAPSPIPFRSALRCALYAAAVLLVILGVLNGGARDVLVKAINICTECIGLG